MCLNPQNIVSNSKYVTPFTMLNLSVPCGHCDECREILKNEWRTRMSFEIDHTYSECNGVCMFLTFTFNEENLSTFSFVDNQFLPSTPFMCFDHSKIHTFLNSMRVYFYRNYQFSNTDYRYFIAEEYGKNTKRPHLHMCLHINKKMTQSEYYNIVEHLRSIWKYGFMFPKFDVHRNMYVDNFGKPSSPFFRDKVASGKYVSKYVLKDLSFYKQSGIKEYSELTSYTKKTLFKNGFKYSYTNSDFTPSDKLLSDEFNPASHPYGKIRYYKQIVNNIFPSHFQSKSYGSLHSKVKNILNQVDNYSNANNLVENGVENPLTHERETLISYYSDKLQYKFVWLGEKNLFGERKYVRTPTNFRMLSLNRRFKEKTCKLYNKLTAYFNNRFSADALRELSYYAYSYRCLNGLSYDFIFRHFGNPYDSKVASFVYQLSHLGTFAEEYIKEHNISDIIGFVTKYDADGSYLYGQKHWLSLSAIFSSSNRKLLASFPSSHASEVGTLEASYLHKMNTYKTLLAEYELFRRSLRKVQIDKYNRIGKLNVKLQKRD